MYVRGVLLSLSGLALLLVLWLTSESPAPTVQLFPAQTVVALPIAEVITTAVNLAQSATTVEAVAQEPAAEEDLRDSYCLWPDDILGDIAVAAGVSVESILAANPDYTGYAGSSIFLPLGSIPPDQWTIPRPVVPTIDQLPFGVSGYYIGYDNRTKRVALSFDIGYVPENHELMRWLADQGIHATFLVMGDPISRHPEVIDHILANGHELGNHSFAHANMLTHSPNDIRGELKLTEKVVQDAHPGVTTKPLFRAPFGAINPSIVQIAAEEGYRVIGWTIDSRDWNEGITADKIYDQVTKNICPGAIVAMHDVNPASKEALPRIIAHLRHIGYSFATVSELLFPPQ